MRILVYLAGLVPLAVVLLLLQARDDADWRVVVGGVIYLLLLRRVSLWLAQLLKKGKR